MWNLSIILYLTSYLLGSTESARILALFPAGYKSHFNYNDAILKTLHGVGHHITMITPFSQDVVLENFTVIDPKALPTYIGTATISEMNSMTAYSFLMWLLMTDISYCESVIKLKEIQHALKSKQKLYDIMFFDMLFLTPCFIPIAEKLNIPVIGTVGLRTLKVADSYIGMPKNPATIPLETVNIPAQMTFMQRLQNTWDHLITDYVKYIIYQKELDQFYQRYFPNYVHDRKKVSILFYNNHHTYFPIPSVPNAIEIGGVHVKAAKPLPQDIANFIDGAKHGVILFTFGSIGKGSSMPANLKNAFVNVFARIPQRVIWKFEDSIEGLSSNVLLSKWLPQRDILEHKNVITFISHCGQAGIYEAIHTATPVVAVPYFIDQHSNAGILEHLGVSVTLDIYKATTEDVFKALNKTIYDPSYMERMQNLSRRFKDRPMSPQDSVIYWTEYVLRHDGAPHLRPIGADIPLYQYLLLDVIGFAFIVIVIICSITFYILKSLYSLFSSKNATISEGSKKIN